MEDPELEALLAASRPTAPEAFVDRLEGRLLGRQRRARFAVRLRLVAGTAAACAGVALALMLAGANPLSGDPAVRAVSSCKTTLVPTAVRQPVIVIDAKGHEHVRYRLKRGTRPVTVCGPTTAVATGG